ncbi:TRADD-N-associated membrane domain-containing protein [Actinomadura rupiterrae]|uniref:TRADD-N-associated membrane domain-containing protein n=1 Tax=Actinomadura rupiterrae TaxID=559627 RepID=UPI0020A3AE61|nr:hypothetical protein [Actinomadura rupiterrae]MCP2340476.1 vacuolar-type H+-ATPase subunit I/STV1 [Actinomadura rupiterrae]
MQLVRVLIASVFFVIGGIIAITVIDPNKIPKDLSWETVIRVTVLMFVVAITFAGLSRPAERRTEETERVARSLRRSAQLTATPERASRAIDDMAHQISELETTIQDLRSRPTQAREIRSLRKEMSELRERLADYEEAADIDDARLSVLIEVYSQALTQLRSSYRINQIIATVGTVLIFIGVGVSIFRSGGQQVAGIIITASGLITNLTSGLFFAQTNRAREHLERQANPLRDEVRLGELIKQSEAVIERVVDPTRRDQLRSKIVQRILNQADAIAEEEEVIGTGISSWREWIFGRGSGGKKIIL